MNWRNQMIDLQPSLTPAELEEREANARDRLARRKSRKWIALALALLAINGLRDMGATVRESAESVIH